MNDIDLKLILNQMHKSINNVRAVLSEVASYADGCHEMNKTCDALDGMMRIINSPPAVVTAEGVKRLREHTGEGLMACKKALVYSKGDFNEAVDYLRRSEHMNFCTDRNRPALGART